MTTKAGFKILTIQVPDEVDISEVEGMRIPSEIVNVLGVLLR